MNNNKTFAITIGIMFIAITTICLAKTGVYAYELKTMNNLAKRGLLKDVTLTKVVKA